MPIHRKPWVEGRELRAVNLLASKAAKGTSAGRHDEGSSPYLHSTARLQTVADHKGRPSRSARAVRWRATREVEAKAAMSCVPRRGDSFFDYGDKRHAPMQKHMARFMRKAARRFAA